MPLHLPRYAERKPAHSTPPLPTLPAQRFDPCIYHNLFDDTHAYSSIRIYPRPIPSATSPPLDHLRRPRQLQHVREGHLVVEQVQPAEDAAAHAEVGDALLGAAAGGDVEEGHADGDGDEVEELAVMGVSGSLEPRGGAAR